MPASDPVIVVGVDRSEGAKAALQFALEESMLREATLRIVHAWQYGYLGASGLEAVVPAADGDVKQLHAAAESALNAIVQDSITECDATRIDRRVVQGRPAAVLVDESHDAELLVVGSRGHGGFAGLLLGSVSEQCAHHAPCPVVIVHPPAGH